MRASPCTPPFCQRCEGIAPGRVALEIQDLQGRTVASLLDGLRAAGLQAVRWDGRDRDGRRLPAGVYWARLRVNGETVSRKLIRE